jgi:hypothetical protein
LTAALALAAAVSAAHAESKPVKVQKSWSGEVKLDLRKEAPNEGYVADKEAWAKLWKAYRGGDAPEVDFDKELVLVAVNDDPNTIDVLPALDDKGDLTVVLESALVGYLNPTTCAYRFALIRREGVKTIGGEPVGKSKKDRRIDDRVAGGDPVTIVDSKPVEIQKTWAGQGKRDLRKEARKAGYVADKEEWAKLWKAYCDGDAPDVDFDKELVLVAVGNAPYPIEIFMGLDDKGNLISDAGRSNGRRYPNRTNGAYRFEVIRREGIKTIEGKPVGKSKLEDWDDNLSPFEDSVPEGSKEVKVQKSWLGHVKLDLQKEAPTGGYVTDKEAWAKLWKAYRGGDAPEVDFDKELVLVKLFTVGSWVEVMPYLNDKGDLGASLSTTDKGPNGTTCGYLFAVIRREGVKTIGDKPVGKSEEHPSVDLMFSLRVDLIPEGSKRLEVQKSWLGEVKLDLKKEAPKEGYVADKEAWAKLWKAYRGGDAPEVDFDKELVLVTVDDFDAWVRVLACLDDEGDLTVRLVYPDEAQKTIACTYEFAVIRREGVKTIGGKPFAKP